MNIDITKLVKDLTFEELEYLYNKAKAEQGEALEYNKYGPREYLEYPKFLPQLNIVVQNEQEEKEALKQIEAKNNPLTILGTENLKKQIEVEEKHLKEKEVEKDLDNKDKKINSK